MKITTFSPDRGLIHGDDVARISCDKTGVLKIGTTKIKVSPEESVLPILFGGCTGNYKATFTDDSGTVFKIEKVTVKGGRIVPPPQNSVDFMELRCRADALEARCAELEEKVFELEHIFDTNSLNFLIK